jgi:putative SOS response-associated peptidase YedK
LDSLYSFSILTTRPNATMQDIHDRMPVFLHSSEWTHWLNPQFGIEDLNYLLDPYPDDGLKSHIVPPAVGNVRNNGPHLIEPELRLF